MQFSPLLHYNLSKVIGSSSTFKISKIGFQNPIHVKQHEGSIDTSNNIASHSPSELYSRQFVQLDAEAGSGSFAPNASAKLKFKFPLMVLPPSPESPFFIIAANSPKSMRPSCQIRTATIVQQRLQTSNHLFFI